MNINIPMPSTAIVVESESQAWQIEYQGTMYNVVAMRDGGLILQKNQMPHWRERRTFIREIKPAAIGVAFKEIEIARKIGYVELAGDSMLKVYELMEGIPAATPDAVKVFHNGEYFFLRD